MPITDVTVRNAKPKDKPYKLADERGLYLEVSSSGCKWWRLKYRFEGKEKRISLGVYPDIGLKDARERRDEARKQVANGIDPSQHRKTEKAAKLERSINTFEVLAREWHEQGVKYGFDGKPWSDDYAERIKSRLERDVFPSIGHRPIAEIKAPELRTMIKPIAARTLETAHRALRDCSSIFRYSIAHGRAENDPTVALRGKGGQGLLPPVPVNHFPSITDPIGVGELLRAIDGYIGTRVVQAALRLAPLLFVRPGELRAAEWSAFNFKICEWRIAATGMKMGGQHIVPLSRQAVAILQDLRTVTGNNRFVFPGVRGNGRPMSENTVNVALRALGYPRDIMTGHGFRSMASTLLNELGWNGDAIERQLSHSERDGVRAAYNYAEYLAERRKMMQAWADYLDTLKTFDKAEQHVAVLHEYAPA